jgi:hypothetical protein
MQTVLPRAVRRCIARAAAELEKRIAARANALQTTHDTTFSQAARFYFPRFQRHRDDGASRA